MTQADILEALRACFDPAWKLDVVELGMVHAVELAVDSDAPGSGIAGVPLRYRLELGLLRPQGEGTDERCALLQAQIVNRLAGMEGLSRVQIEWQPEPTWTPAHISPPGRLALGLEPALFAILNNKPPAGR